MLTPDVKVGKAIIHIVSGCRCLPASRPPPPPRWAAAPQRLWPRALPCSRLALPFFSHPIQVDRVLIPGKKSLTPKARRSGPKHH